jgi:hypothetical protein
MEALIIFWIVVAIIAAIVASNKGVQPPLGSSYASCSRRWRS